MHGFFMFSYNPLDTMKKKRDRIDQVMGGYTLATLNMATLYLPDGLLPMGIYTSKKMRLSLHIGGKRTFNLHINELADI